MNTNLSTHTHVSNTKTSEKHGESFSESLTKIKHLVSTLPRQEAHVLTELCQYHGYWYPPIFLEGILLAQEKHHAKPTDILICSSVKVGTTWLKALCFAIYTRANYDDSSSPLLTASPHDCVPFLEMDLARITARKDDDLPLISTHMPYTALPKSVLDSGCKIIYIYRDPKDTFISLWFFINKYRKSEGNDPISLEDALDLFSKGSTIYGPFWDHVLEFWNASLENPGGVLFLKYEDMMEDTSFYAKKLASFMGCSFSVEEEMAGLVEKIVGMCSLRNLSNLDVNKNGYHRPETPIVTKNDIFFRKGSRRKLFQVCHLNSILQWWVPAKGRIQTSIDQSGVFKKYNDMNTTKEYSLPWPSSRRRSIYKEALRARPTLVEAQVMLVPLLHRRT